MSLLQPHNSLFTPWPVLDFSLLLPHTLPRARALPCSAFCTGVPCLGFDLANLHRGEGGRGNSQSLPSACSPSSQPIPRTCPSQTLARIPSHSASWNSPGTLLSRLSPWGSCPWVPCKAHPVPGPQRPGPSVLPAAGAASFLEFLMLLAPVIGCSALTPLGLPPGWIKGESPWGSRALDTGGGTWDQLLEAGSPAGGLGEAKDLRPRPRRRAGR